MKRWLAGGSIAACLCILTPRLVTAEKPVEEGYVSTDDGIRLYYRSVGRGPQTVVVPLGFMMFDDFKHLAGSRRFVFYDMRNRGRSDAVQDPQKLTIQQDVLDLERVRRDLKIERMSLIGESYLGLMVVLYALDHPERVDRIVQIGPVPLRYGTEYPKALTASADSTVLDPKQGREIKRLYAQEYHVKQPREFCEKDWKYRSPMLVGNPANAAKVAKGYCDLPNEWPVNFWKHLEHHFGSVQKLDVPKDRLRGASMPVLTIHGTKDRNAPYGAGREWAMILPDARLVTVAGAAHLPWVDEPALVFESIDRFLGGRWPQAAQKVATLEPAAHAP